MCGIFGFAGNGSAQPGLLLEAGMSAANRGPHAWGVAWENGQRVERAVFPGRLEEKKWKGLPVAGRWVLGACRLATFGGWQKQENNQPYVDGDVTLVFNGNVYGWEGLCQRWGYRGKGENDMQALVAGLFFHGGTSLSAGLAKTLSVAIPEAAYAVCVHRGNEVALMRRGHPVYAVEDERGIYFSSRLFSGAKLVPENTPLVWRVDR